MRRHSLPVVGDRGWSDAPRPMSIPTRKLQSEEIMDGLDLLQPVDREALRQRPLTRADCVNSPRPCPWIGCRFHLYLDVSDKGWLKLNHPHLDPLDMQESCALDVADREEDKGITLERLGQLLNISGCE